MFIHRSNIRDRSGGAGLGSIKGKHTKRGTKSSLLLPQSPQKKNGGFFETTEPVGPSIVPVKEQPSTYTSDDITAHDNRSAACNPSALSYTADLHSVVDAFILEIFLPMLLTCLMILVINFQKNMRYAISVVCFMPIECMLHKLVTLIPCNPFKTVIILYPIFYVAGFRDWIGTTKGGFTIG